ncbi:MAG: FAD-binding oxidoreductase [Candidatus Hodarchaeota archaeon]
MSEEYIPKDSLASIIKWGKLDHFYRVPKQLIPILEDMIGLDPDDQYEHYENLKELNVALPPPKLDKVSIAKLEDIVGKRNISTRDYDRVWCATGWSYYDVIRLRLGQINTFPDVIIYPATHDEVQAILTFTHDNKIPIIPLGGRTGVTQASETFHGGIVIDLSKRMNKILELDEKSLTVRCQAGIMLPDLEAYLNEKGYLLGHFPQSFEESTLGGSIVTRGAGQQSTKYGKIEDMIFGLLMATPIGTKRTVELPACAMGPDLCRVIAGSEGILGVVTEATMKIHPYLPQTRDFATFIFKNFSDGLSAIREIMRYGVTPATVRLSDPEETSLLTRLETTRKKKSTISSTLEKIIKKYLARKGYLDEACLLILEFEGEGEIVKLTKSKSKSFCKKWGGFSIGKRAAKEWWANRFELPYLRDDLMDLGILVDTIETAAPWSRIESLYNAVIKILREHAEIIMTHCSHCYREGGALYFTFVTKRKRGQEAQQILDIQQDVLTVFEKEKCALSHHHGIGRMAKKWFMNHPEAEVMIALKKLWDPNNIMNPGNLIDF